MKAEYAFITHWQFKAPVEKVWDAIHDSLDWPNWWKGVVKVTEIEKGGMEGLQGIREYTWGSILPYELTFRMRLTELEKYKRMKGLALGDLEGEGEWLFSEKEGITFVTYNWTVFTNKAWMNYLSFLLKPLFSFNHNVVMKWGANGLARKLNAPLIKR